MTDVIPLQFLVVSSIQPPPGKLLRVITTPIPASSTHHEYTLFQPRIISYSLLHCLSLICAPRFLLAPCIRSFSHMYISWVFGDNPRYSWIQGHYKITNPVGSLHVGASNVRGPPDVNKNLSQLLSTGTGSEGVFLHLSI